MTLFGDNPTVPPPKPTRPQWSAVGGRGRCDHCVKRLMTGDLTQVQPARWRRVHNGRDLRLCYEHARPIRATDDEEKQPSG